METVVFVVGVVVFAITIWGTVMAGGLKLTRIQIEENPEFEAQVDKKELDKPLPTDVEY